MAGSTPASATDVRPLSPRAKAPARPVPRTEAPWRGFLSRFRRNWIGLSGAIIVVLRVVVRAVGARQRAVIEGDGVRPGGAGARPGRARDPGATRRAERAGADDRADQLQPVHGHPDGGVVELSGIGHAAVDSIVGVDA